MSSCPYSAYPLLPSLETLKVDTSVASMRLTVLPIDWSYRDPGEYANQRPFPIHTHVVN